MHAAQPRVHVRAPLVEVLLGYGSQKFVDRQRGQRADLRRSTRAQGNGHARDRCRVVRFDDVDEVVLTERRPLVKDFRAELLDVAVDLTQTVRIRFQGLNALRR